MPSTRRSTFWDRSRRLAIFRNGDLTVNNNPHYRHEYEKVELVPMEEFMSTQMETDIPRDEYHLMIARLEDEHGRRRQLTERLAVAKRARDVAMERVKQSRKELDLVRDQVKSILKMADSLKLSKSFLPAAVVVRQETASQPVIEESKLVGLAALNDCFQAFLRDNADLCISSSFYEQSNISNQSTSVVTFDEEEDEVEDSASIASGPVSPVKKAAHEQHPQHIHHQSSRGRESVESLPRFKHSYLEVSFQKGIVNNLLIAPFNQRQILKALCSFSFITKRLPNRILHLPY